MASRAGVPTRDSLSYPGLPRMPVELAHRGLCASGAYACDLWTSRKPASREAAVRICRQCPVRELCESWALALPLSDTAIYAGLRHAERARLVRQLSGSKQPAGR